MKSKKVILASFIFPANLPAKLRQPVTMVFNSYADFLRCRDEQQPLQVTLQEIDLISYEDGTEETSEN